MSNLSRIVMGLFLVQGLSGCNRANNTEDIKVDSTSEVYGVMANRNMNQYPLNKLVCDPMNNTQVISEKNGIAAHLSYRGAAQSRWYKVLEYLNLGIQSEKSLFFNDLHVPTRVFSKGFSTQTSGVVKNDQGENLVEYFGLEFKSKIRLDRFQPTQKKDFAILADDGVIFSGLKAGSLSTIINIDGDHPTKMGCASGVVVDGDSGLDMNLAYYQGPRDHIALVMLWRPSVPGQDSLCGQSGNSLFFDYNKNSAPQQAYKDLLARGWEPITADHFYLPDDKAFNPCVEGEALSITDFRVSEGYSDSADLVWTTDRAATSQVLIKNLSTQEETLSDSDQVLRLQHSLRVSNLKSGATYELKAISVAEDGAKVQSSAIQFTAF